MTLIENKVCTHCKFTVRIDKGPLLIHGNSKYSSKCSACNNWFEFMTKPGDMLSSYTHSYEPASPSKLPKQEAQGPIVTPSVVSEAKPPLHLFMQLSDFMSLVAMTFWYGGQRPGRIVMGWLKTGETKEKVLGGLMRHLASLERGERIDPVTKEDNLANFGACAVMYIVLTLRSLWK